MSRKRVLMFLPLLPVAALVIMTSLASPAASTPSEGSACSNCHANDAAVSISVTLQSQTSTTATYAVSGSTNRAGQGWAAFSGTSKVASGFGSSTFTVAKNGASYTVYWVDKNGGSMLGSASTTVTAPMPTTTTTAATTATTGATT
ncbi:MAG: hypothetical protein ACYCX3_04325, partial [Thermoleophilia bacterium]